MTDAKLTAEPELKDLCDFLQGRCDVAQVGKNEARIQVRVSDLRALIAAARAALAAHYRSEVALLKARAAAADDAGNDAEWMLAMSILKRTEAELAGLTRGVAH